MEQDELTQTIIGCAYKVSNTLGSSFVEKVYENALALEIRKTGLKIQQQYPLKVFYDGVIVGEFVANLLVEDQILLELKAVKDLNEVHAAKL